MPVARTTNYKFMHIGLLAGLNIGKVPLFRCRVLRDDKVNLRGRRETRGGGGFPLLCVGKDHTCDALIPIWYRFLPTEFLTLLRPSHARKKEVEGEREAVRTKR